MENTVQQFSELKISPELKKGIEELGYVTPTDFQWGVFESFSHGKHVLGDGQSSYGKSLAFSLPILSKIVPDQQGPQALIVCETQLLSDLCVKECKALGRHLNILVGSSLTQSPHILVWSIQDLLKADMATFEESIRTVFFDGLNSESMAKAIDKLVDLLSRGVQVMVFGRDAINTCRTKNNEIFNEAVVISNNDQPKIVPPAQHIVHQAKDTEPKARALLAALLFHKPKFALISVHESSDADFLARYVQRYGFRTQVVSEEQNRGGLKDALRDGLHGSFDVLVCQNTLLSGQSLEQVLFMINYDMFDRPQAYEQVTQFSKQAPGVNRIIVNIVTPRESGFLGPIKAHCLIDMKEMPLPVESEILDLAINRVVGKLSDDAQSVELGQFTELAERFLKHKDAAQALSLLLRNYLTKPKEHVDMPRRDFEGGRERRAGYDRARPYRERDRDREPEREREGDRERERPQSPAMESSDGISRLYVTLGRKDGFLDLTALAQYISDLSKVDLGHFSGGGMIRDTSAHIEVDDDVAEEVIKAVHASPRPNAQDENNPVVCERAKGPREPRQNHRYQPRRRSNYQRR